MPRLVVEELGKKTVLELESKERVTVGRGRKSTVVLADAAASREHCALERDSKGLWLVDLGSRNGTSLNGRRVKGKALLRPGDRIEIGLARLVFDEGKQAANDEKAAQDALARDPDTGLATYALVRAEIGRRIVAADGPVAVVKLDVDALGLLNSVLGYEAADTVIAAVARAVDAAVVGEEAEALVGHEAGGKLVAVLPGCDMERGREVAEAARAAVAAAASEGELLLPSVTLSCGVAVSPHNGRSWRSLLRAAEAALAEAKRGGRDRVALAPGPLEREGTTKAKAPHPSGFDTEVTAPPVPLERRALDAAGQRALELVAHALGSDLDLDGLAEFVLGVVARETGATRGILVLRDEAGELRLGAAVSPQAPGSAAAPASHGLVRAALERPAGILLEDAQLDAELGGTESVAASGVRSVVAAAIVWGESPIGAIYLENNEGPGMFDAAALDLVRAFGRLVAGPIRRGLLHSRALDELARARLALQGTLEEDARLLARFRGIVGRSAAVKRLLKTLDRVADRPLPVIVTGESGTGKELVARALHARSRRAKGPFIAENCAALPDELLEAELFGYRKGAFTGADRDRTGLLEAAHEGTLFLDEVGDMSERLQAKLLRFLQEGELRPLGDDRVRHVSVRVVCATNRDLRALVEEGKFREDLYYRLAVLRVEVPPLRDRREDIPLLVEHLATKAARELGRPVPKLEPEVLAVLTSHEWPGNVRQLENEVRKLVALGIDPIRVEHLSQDILGAGGAAHAVASARERNVQAAAGAVMRAVAEGRSLVEALDLVEKEIVSQTLEATRGNRSETARRLGLSRPGLRGKMRRLGLEGL